MRLRKAAIGLACLALAGCGSKESHHHQGANEKETETGTGNHHHESAHESAHEGATSPGDAEHHGPQQAVAFACPMKCEGDKTYKQAGHCPVCVMTLYPVKPGDAAEIGDSATHGSSGHHQDQSAHHDPAHGHASGAHHDPAHMKHMAEIRDWLKKKLGEKYHQPVPRESDQQRAKGQEIFLQTCMVCHGAGGKGDGPGAVALLDKPADFTDPAHATYYSDQGRLHIIRKGIPDTPMVGWGDILSEAEIQAVYAYVRSLRAPQAGGHE